MLFSGHASALVMLLLFSLMFTISFKAEFELKLLASTVIYQITQLLSMFVVRPLSKNYQLFCMLGTS